MRRIGDHGGVLRLRFLVERLTSTWWFIPSLMALAGLVLAVVMLTIDGLWQPHPGSWLALLVRGDAESVRTVLSTIAGSMITVAGVAFSITIVVLALASAQFGPRLLRGFITDRFSQLVLGIFIATFIYCLAVLKAAQNVDDHVFIPHLSTAVAVLAALASIGGLILFIHRVTASIQAKVIIARASSELDAAIHSLTAPLQGADLSGERPRSGSGPVEAMGGEVATAPDDGYVQRVDHGRLLERALSAQARIQVLVAAGDHVHRGQPLAIVRGAVGEAALRRCIDLGLQRSPLQDIGFGALQLVEVAVRSLSPGINDPFTAIHVIDAMGGPLSRLAGRSLPKGQERDEAGRVVLSYPVETWSDIVATAFDQLRRHAAGHPAVLVRLLATLGRIADACGSPERREPLRRQARLIADLAADPALADADRQAVLAAWRNAGLDQVASARPGSNAVVQVGTE